MKLLALFQFSTKFKPSLISRRNSSECKQRQRKMVFIALPSSARALYVGCCKLLRVKRRRMDSVSAMPRRSAVRVFDHLIVLLPNQDPVNRAREHRLPVWIFFGLTCFSAVKLLCVNGF